MVCVNDGVKETWECFGGTWTIQKVAFKLLKEPYTPPQEKGLDTIPDEVNRGDLS